MFTLPHFNHITLVQVGSQQTQHSKKKSDPLGETPLGCRTKQMPRSEPGANTTFKVRRFTKKTSKVCTPCMNDKNRNFLKKKNDKQKHACIYGLFPLKKPCMCCHALWASSSFGVPNKLLILKLVASTTVKKTPKKS